MTWNYRVVHKTQETPYGVQEQYSIHEVYYGGDGAIILWEPKPSWPFGETERELIEDIAAMTAAYTKPVLEYNDMPGT